MQAAGFTKSYIKRELVLQFNILFGQTDLLSQYRSQQFRAIARFLPLSVCATYLVVFAGAIAASMRADGRFFALWSISLFLLSSLHLAMWVHFVLLAPTRSVSTSATLAFAINLGTGALLYTVMVTYLFGEFGTHDKVFLAAIATAFIATGTWMFAALPVAAYLWVVTLCGGCALGMGLYHRSEFFGLLPLLLLYAAFLLATVFVTSSKFIAALAAETEIREQRQLVDLLLRDFEDGANDWLWEIDQQGQLTYVPPRFADVAALDVSDMIGVKLLDLIRQLAEGESAESGSAILRFEQSLARPEPFNNVEIGIVVRGEPRWWSLRAKPLINGLGQTTGWRGVGSDITLVKEREIELFQQANKDILTGLANRRRFRLELDKLFPTANEALPATLFLIDLDGFKNINDTLGHTAGDELLCEVARRLTAVCGASATVARLGGDEFAILIPDIVSDTGMKDLARQISGALNQPWHYQQYDLVPRASVGCACAPKDAGNASDLLKVCDLALYSAKRSGRDAVHIFKREMLLRAERAQTLLKELRNGLTDGSVMVFYQPQIGLVDHRLYGFEALVRWQHPRLGTVHPEEFIPLAEDSGFILELGNWILQRACCDAVNWPGELRLAVNVSTIQVERLDLNLLVMGALSNSGLSAERLELEITESLILNESATVNTQLNDLRASGVRIALDDFGTGFSSLSQLRTLPLDKLKIDRSFIRRLTSDGQFDLKSRAIIEAIVLMAKHLQIDTTAEGIESIAQHSALLAMGCQFGQGYLYAPAMNALDTSIFITKWTNSLHQGSQLFQL